MNLTKNKNPLFISILPVPLRGGLHARLALLAVALALPACAWAGNLAGRYATITLDGNLADWLPARDTMYGPSEIGAGAPLNTTFTNVMVANDSTNLYIALQLPASAAITNTWTYNVFIDTDLIATTGFNGNWMGAGYNVLVQYGASGTTYSVYNFTGAAQSDWTWNWISLIEYAYSDLVIEWAIPISSLGLTTNKMKMEFNVTGDGVTTETWAYQWESGVGTYTLATPPPPTPPTLTAVQGSPNKISVSFSKPVTAATAGATSNYALDGGLSVLTATPDPLDSSKVTLTTSAQTRGTVYVLTVNGIADGAGHLIGANSQMAFISTILLDGSFDDWEGVPLLYSQDQGLTNAAEWKEVYAYNDAEYIYFHVTLWEPNDLLNAQNNFFFDTDNDSTTGNASWGGSELLIQEGVGYQEKNGGFNEGLVNGLDFAMSNSGGTNFEFRISRAATYASDGLPVFTTNIINFAFDGEENWLPVNRMPVTAGVMIAYQLLESAVLPPGPLSIGVSGGQATVRWSGLGTLQACPSLSGSWTNVPSATSPYTTPASAGQLYFRLMR